jgi:RNA-binding protein 26
MIFDPTTAPHLKPWLVRTLEPMYVCFSWPFTCNILKIRQFRCDAEPGALADYILALLKHNVPENEMRKELASQLEEFLENGTYF